MPEVEVKNIQNEKTGTMTLDEPIFGAVVSKGLLHEIVLMQQASMRQGTASTKTKGFVSGGGKKPWKQKGTGRARAGSNRSPIWRGGGTTFGPLPRSYQYDIPKKKSRKALFSALSSKVKEGKLVILEDLEISEPKTKAMANLLARLGLQGKILLVVSQILENLDRAARNLPQVKMLEVRQLNVYDLLLADTVVITRRDVARLVEVWGNHESA
ncbi:MAG: 50S ribosomal protein L4 [Candidatus Manganitrophaceae bacterium]|nr:MAG: 50S ribosomal protein L4 [Candidatus Manganitrophaceae bacterium]